MINSTTTRTKREENMFATAHIVSVQFRGCKRKREGEQNGVKSAERNFYVAYNFLCVISLHHPFIYANRCNKQFPIRGAIYTLTIHRKIRSLTQTEALSLCSRCPETNFNVYAKNLMTSLKKKVSEKRIESMTNLWNKKSLRRHMCLLQSDISSDLL